MYVKIRAIDSGWRYAVNGKIVYLNTDGQWVATQELTENEKRFFNEHITAIENEIMPGTASGTYIP